MSLTQLTMSLFAQVSVKFSLHRNLTFKRIPFRNSCCIVDSRIDWSTQGTQSCMFLTFFIFSPHHENKWKAGNMTTHLIKQRSCLSLWLLVNYHSGHDQSYIDNFTRTLYWLHVLHCPSTTSHVAIIFLVADFSCLTEKQPLAGAIVPNSSVSGVVCQITSVPVHCRLLSISTRRWFAKCSNQHRLC